MIHSKHFSSTTVPGAGGIYFRMASSKATSTTKHVSFVPHTIRRLSAATFYGSSNRIQKRSFWGLDAIVLNTVHGGKRIRKCKSLIASVVILGMNYCRSVKRTRCVNVGEKQAAKSSTKIAMPAMIIVHGNRTVRMQRLETEVENFKIESFPPNCKNRVVFDSIFYCISVVGGSC